LLPGMPLSVLFEIAGWFETPSTIITGECFRITVRQFMSSES